MSKRRFFNTHSSLEINKSYEGDRNIKADWHREAQQRRMLIDGKWLGDYAPKYQDFSTEQDVENFFKEVLLKKMTALTKKEKERTLSYLMSTFHQGSLLYPVTSALAFSMREGERIAATLKTIEIQELRLITTEKGLKIQEYTKIKDLIVSDRSGLANLADENGVLRPEPGHDFILEAEGTIAIDFSEKTDEPRIYIESNSLNFGHTAIQKKLDDRNLFQILVDFLKDLFGFNIVNDIKPDERSYHM